MENRVSNQMLPAKIPNIYGYNLGSRNVREGGLNFEFIAGSPDKALLIASIVHYGCGLKH